MFRRVIFIAVAALAAFITVGCVSGVTNARIKEEARDHVLERSPGAKNAHEEHQLPQARELGGSQRLGFLRSPRGGFAATVQQAGQGLAYAQFLPPGADNGQHRTCSQQ